MTDLDTASVSVETFLNELAAGESTPGGGAAAALTACQAAALLSMVLNFTVGRKKYAAVEEESRGYLLQTEALRAKLLGLADQDAEAFGAVAACFTMPRSTEEEKAARAEAMQSALREAAEGATQYRRALCRALGSDHLPLQKRATRMLSVMRQRRPTWPSPLFTAR